MKASKITFNHGTKDIQILALQQLNEAERFITELYGDILIPYELEFGHGTHSFCTTDGFSYHRIFISCRHLWCTYKIKSLRYYAAAINTGEADQILFALIHELTHHIQFIRAKRAGRRLRFGEKEPTLNELKYCLLYRKQHLKRLADLRDQDKFTWRIAAGESSL